MPLWLHRTTKEVLRSVPSAELPEPVANYIEEPDLSLLDTVPVKYIKIEGDDLVEMTRAEKNAVDAAELSTQRDAETAQFDAPESVIRALVLVLLDELNAHAATTNAILNAIDNATSLADLQTAIGAISNLPSRTPSQARTAIRNRLGT